MTPEEQAQADEEELALLEMERERARAASVPKWALMPKEAPDPVTLDATNTGAVHVARHLSGGLGDKIIAALQSAKEFQQDKTGKTFGQIYDHNLAFNDQLFEDSDKAHSTAKWVGNGIGFGGNLAALAVMAPARAALAARGLVPAATEALPAATILGRAALGAKEGAKTGAIFGGVGGFGSARGDNAMSHTALSAALGLLTGGTIGAASGAVAGKIAARSRTTQEPPPTVADIAKETNQQVPLIARGVTPDPEAQVLQKYGVNLTMGQMRPGGIASEAEEAALRVPLLGKAIEAQRQVPEQQWRDAVINQARTPLEGPLRAGDAMGALNGLKKDFDVAYGQIADRPAAALASHPETGELVHPREALKAIFADPAYQAGSDDLRAVAGVFRNALTKMDRMQKAGEPIKAGLLIDMREGLRDAAQLARLNGNHSASMMYQDAADSITGGLKGTILARDVDFLNKTDAAYSNFMKVAGATKRAGLKVDEGEFGPKQLSAELMKSYGLKFATDKDAGGPLRELARAGKYAFTPRESRTGFGEVLKAPFGWSMGLPVYLANKDPATQRLFMLAAQRAAESQPKFLPPSAGEVEQALGRFIGQAPTAASSVNPVAAALRGYLEPRRQ